MNVTGPDAERASAPTANERLRSSWNARLQASTLVAVFVHAVAFWASPSWFAVPAEVEVPELPVSRFVVLPDLSAGGVGGGGGTVLSPELAEAAGTDEGEDDGSGGGRGGERSVPSLGELWEAFGERLQRASLRASLAEPEIVPESREPEAERPVSGTDEGSLRIGGTAATADLAALPEPDSLALDRLSALRPELSFMAASAWVLIRNQEEVETFLRRAYRSGVLDRSASGSVSVTLWIDRRGSVEWAEVTESSGRRDLDEFTLALFNEVADFRAARERGVSVSRSVTFQVNYPW